MAKRPRPRKRPNPQLKTRGLAGRLKKPFIPGRFYERKFAGRRVRYYKSPNLSEAEKKRLKRLFDLHPNAFTQEYIARRIKYTAVFADCALRLKECNIEINLDKARIREEQTDSGHMNIYIEGINLSGKPRWEEANITLIETIRQREKLETYMIKCHEINWENESKLRLQKYPLDISNALNSIELFIRSRGRTEILSYSPPKKH